MPGSIVDCATGSAAASATRLPARNVLKCISPHYMRHTFRLKPEATRATERAGEAALRAALAVHYLRRELVVFGQIDVILGPRLGFREALEIGEDVLHAGDVDPAEEVGQPLAVLALGLI